MSQPEGSSFRVRPSGDVEFTARVALTSEDLALIDAYGVEKFERLMAVKMREQLVRMGVFIPDVTTLHNKRV